MALLYKGYAQQKGFGSYVVNVPDPSKKIRDQGIQAMAHMKDQIEWNNKQASRIEDQLVQNANLETQQNKANFELGQEMNKVIHDQKVRNFQDRIDAAKAKQAQTERNWKNILSLTKSGSILYKTFKDKQKKDGLNYALMLREEHGVGMKELNTIQSYKEELWNNASALEQRLSRDGLNHLPEDVLQEIKSISGYKRIAIAEEDARRWARNRPQFYQENRNTKVNIPGYTDVDLDSATGAQVDTVLQLLDRRAREALGDNAPSSKIMGSAGAWTILENAKAQVRAEKASTARKDAVGERHNDEHIIINSHIANARDGSIDVGAGIIKSIKYYAGPNPTPEDWRRGKKRVFDALNAGVVSGYWNASKFQGAGSHVFQHSSGKVRIDKIFKKEWLKLEDAMVNGVNREYNVANIAVQQNKVKDREYLSEIMGFDWSRVTVEQAKKMQTQSQLRGFTDSANFIGNQITRMANTQGDQVVLGNVTDAIRDNRYLSPQEIRQMGASPAATQQAINMMEESSQFLPNRYGHAEEIEGQLEAWLEVQIPTPLTGRQDATRSSAYAAILQETRGQYKAFMTKPGATPEAAREHALSYAKERIFKSKDFMPEYDPATSTYGFPIGKIKIGAGKLEMDHDVIATKIQKDRSAIYSEPMMDVNKLRVKSENLNKGIQQDLLPRSVFIESASRGTIKALEAEQAQIELLNKKLKEQGQTLIRPYPDWYVKEVTKAYDRFNPSVYRLLNKWDYCKVNQAACASGSNPIYTKPVYDKARTIVMGTLGTRSRGDYNATETKASTDRSDLKNIRLINASIGEIIIMQQKGLLTTAGRYQFNVEELTQAMEAAGIPSNTKFDAVTQDKLFDAFFKVNGPAMINTIESEEDRTLLESLHESVSSDKLNALKFNSPSTLNLAAYKELQRRGVYNAA